MDYECGIIEAARQSTSGSFRGWDKDERLLKYLKEHHHDTPFEFSGMVMEVKAPIFIFREWHRHRTQSYNEMSSRYIPIPDEHYVPTVDRMLMNTGVKNKQAGKKKGSGELTAAQAVAWRTIIERSYFASNRDYENMLEAGIPKEVARVVMPVGRYSQMRAKTCLRNWLGFLTLRMDPAAQWEIRQFANAVGELIQNNFPKTWDLYIGMQEQKKQDALELERHRAAKALSDSFYDRLS